MLWGVICLAGGYIIGCVLTAAGFARRVIRGVIKLHGRVYVCRDSGPVQR